MYNNLLIKLTFLGTGSSYPSPSRNASGIILHHDINGNQWLFDCGEGTQIQIQKLKDTKYKRITKIFITHLHGDHVYGLPGLLSSMAQTDNEDTLINIYGPVGLKKFIRTCLGISNHHLNFKYSVHEIFIDLKDCPEDWQSLTPLQSNDQPLPYEVETELIFSVYSDNNESAWKLFYDDKCKTTVWAIPLKHSVPSLGFVILSDDKQGQLNIKKATELGVPNGPLLGQLKNGVDVTLSNGQTIHHEEVVLNPKPGLNLAILGDSCNSDSLISFMKRNDIQVGKHAPKLNYLVHEVTFENGMGDYCMKKGHSDPNIVSELALKVNVDNLIITHFSQRYFNENEDVSGDKKTVSILKDQVLENLKDSCKVIVAEDLLSVDLK